MRILAGFLGLAALLVLSAPLVANAAPPPRVTAYSCGSLAATIGPRNVWRTWFRGAHRQLFDQIDWYSASPCFKTRAACKAWLYWAQTDWPIRNTFRPCRKGIGY
jgi:hypothetical protein